MDRFLFFLIVSTFFLAIYSCNDKTPAVKNSIDSLAFNEPDQISKNIKVLFIDSSYTKAILKADKGRIYQLNMETYLDGNVRVEFFGKSSIRETILTADSAMIDDNTKDMLAWGNVIVQSDSTGRRLQTKILKWIDSTRKFYSTEYVRISSPNENLEGYGFESDQDLNNYTIFKVSGNQK